MFAGLNDSWDEKKVLPQHFDAFERRFEEQVVAARQATSAARVFKDWYLQHATPTAGQPSTTSSSTCSTTTSNGKTCRTDTELRSASVDDPVVDLVLHVFDQIAQARQQVAWAVVAAFSQQQALASQRDAASGSSPSSALDTASSAGSGGSKSARNHNGQDGMTTHPFESKEAHVEKETKESDETSPAPPVQTAASATSIDPDVLRLRRICLVGAIEIAVVDLDRVSRSASVLVQLYVDQATNRATRALRRLFGDTGVGSDAARMPSASFQTTGGATKHRWSEKQAELNGQGFDASCSFDDADADASMLLRGRRAAGGKVVAGGNWNQFAPAFADASWGSRSDTLAALAEVALRNVERLLAVARSFQPIALEARGPPPSATRRTLQRLAPTANGRGAELGILRSSSLEPSESQEAAGWTQEKEEEEAEEEEEQSANDREACGGKTGGATWQCFLCGEPNSTTSERCGLCFSPPPGPGPTSAPPGHRLHDAAAPSRWANRDSSSSTTDPGAALFAELAHAHGRGHHSGSRVEKAGSSSCESGWDKETTTTADDDTATLLARLAVHRGKVKQEQSARRSRNEAAQQAQENIAAGIDATGGWYCSVCTFHNDASASRCTVCERGRRPAGARRNRTSERRSPRRSSRLMP